MFNVRYSAAVLLGTLITSGSPARALAPADLQRTYEAAARESTPAFGGFSAQRGEQFFKSTHGAEWSCSCRFTTPSSALGSMLRSRSM